MDTNALRQKILDLAIRGKLVPQDPNDEPASVLLERIRAEKQQMVKDGKLKAKDIKNDTIIFKGEDNLHYEKFADRTVKCIEDEIPFEVPDGWAWARIFTITIDLPYGTAKKSSNDGEIAVLRMGNIQSGEIDYEDLVYSSDEKDIEKYLLQAGDLLFNRTNSAEWVGKTAIYRGDMPAIYAGYLIRIRSFLNAEYLNVVMNSGYAKNYCNYVKTDAVNQSNINAQKLGNFLIPISPVEEQICIDNRITELFPLVSKIQAMRETTSHSIGNVKSKILDLAIRGKLVPQDPNDEPASVLLERIRTENEELIKQGKIKRDKNDSIIYKGDDNSYYIRFGKSQEIIDERLLFNLPQGWEWGTLYQVASVDLGKTLDKEKNTGDFYPYLRSVNIRWNLIDLSNVKEMKFETTELQKYLIQKNDLLICEGGDVGRCCVWDNDYSIQYQNAIHRIRLYQSCNPYYFMYYMMYYESHNLLKSMCAGVTIKHLTGNVLSKIPFALPPLSEQIRIVKAIEKSFAFLNRIIDVLS